MYARSITFQYQPGKLDEGLHLLRETVVPELRQLPGYRGATNLVDRENNKVVGITFWETASNMQDSGQGKLQARFAVVSQLLMAAPTVNTYIVSDQEAVG